MTSTTYGGRVANNDGEVSRPHRHLAVRHVYTGKRQKIAEHGGNNPQDRDVPILVAGGPVDGGEVVTTWVETTQIAPTILELLGLNPHQLKAVRIEHTKALPLGG